MTEISDFLLKHGFEDGATPSVIVQGGSHAMGIAVSTSDKDYYGLHFMDPQRCFEHPDFRTEHQVTRKTYTNALKTLEAGTREKGTSMVSFEIWKFISMLLKGSPVVYDILYLPRLYISPSGSSMLRICRAGITNRIGRTARGSALHVWRKDKAHRKKTIQTYHRLAQALFLLREDKFEPNINKLFEYISTYIPITTGQQVLSEYIDESTRNTRIEEGYLSKLSNEIESLVSDIDKALVVTTLPDRCPRKTLDEILQKMKQIRSGMI